MKPFADPAVEAVFDASPAQDALRFCMAMALTYHRSKRKPA